MIVIMFIFTFLSISAPITFPIGLAALAIDCALLLEVDHVSFSELIFLQRLHDLYLFQ